MKKHQLLFTLLLITACLNSFSQTGIRGLVNAEKAFASFTASHTIKEGFLLYMDSAGIIFRQGEAMNALEAYQKQKPSTAVLSWAPDFAVISTSGDLGVTMGPYEFRTKSLQDTPVGRGSFSSIWHINKLGEWKNMVDLGVSYTEKPVAEPTVNEITIHGAPNKTFRISAIYLLDEKLNKAIQEKNNKEWLPFIAPDGRLNIEGHTPYTGNEAILSALTAFPAGLELHAVGGGLSTARDFAYVYGTVVNGMKKENYVRAWVYRNKQWQVMLQTIKW